MKTNYSEMEIIYKKLDADAIEPTRSYTFDAGLDLYASAPMTLWPGNNALVRTGIALDIPGGYVGLIWPRSGLAKKGLDTLAGVIDCGYHGEILVNLINHYHVPYRIERGDKVAQILIQRVLLATLREIEEFPVSSDRGTNGHGSTG